MAFMSYLARHHDITKQDHHKKRKEIGDYILCRTIGRGASGKFRDSLFLL
jgi:hypothetical protein